MLKTVGIDHLNFIVRDLEESFRFYHQLFGFEILKRQPQENSYIIGNRSIKLCLYEVPGMRRYDRRAGFAHFSIIVENFDDVLATCEKVGAHVWHNGRIIQWENSRSIYIDDPDGYNIEIGNVWGGGLDKPSEAAQ